MGKSLSEHAAAKPYQGVRVKDPVKELLRRKRGHTAKTAPPTAVVIPNNALPPCANLGSSGFMGSNQSAPNDSSVDVGTLCPGWVAQPSSSAVLQTLGHWAPPEYFQHEQTLSTYSSLTTDMFVQPVCPSYAVVGASSVLTLAPAPLFTNLGTINSSSSSLSQVDAQDGSLAYIPWTQSLSACSQTVSSPQQQPMVGSLSKPEPEVVEPSLAPEGTLALEKLLEQEENQKESYTCSPTLFSQDI
ncbi:POU domain class 2-associating factor 1 [Trichomycterus rosablanca]|uniref:POU domain class 2-associating factor 1 n=1 Tax=Trichomycterus rosablanca TaxID=2290929 RepID=UPI002F360EC7